MKKNLIYTFVLLASSTLVCQQVVAQDKEKNNTTLQREMILETGLSRLRRR